MRTMRERIGAIALVLGAIVMIYAGAVRPWFLSWGTTEVERTKPLPGDPIVARARHQVTRALTIEAPLAEVWPWIAQLGQDRAGFYSYELLEDLAGAQMPRAERVLADRQAWRLQDRIWMYPPEKAGGYGGAPLLAYVPGRALGFGTWQLGTPHSAPPDGSWAFVLEPIDADTTRLLVRARAGGGEPMAARLFSRAVYEPAHFAMERKMMESIKALAEGRRPSSRAMDAATVAAWTLTVGLLAWAIAAAIYREAWGQPIACVAAAALIFQIDTLLQPPPLIAVALLAPWVVVLALDSGTPAKQLAA